MFVKDICELEKILCENKIVIYGAGYVAKRFYESLKKRGLAEKIECFVTSKEEKSIFCELPVASINNFSNEESTVICIAVHESIKDEIIELLERKEYYNYVWIYPFQYQLMLGKPLRKAVKVSLADIVLKEKEYYGLAIRYLAIEQYYNKNEIGYEMYVKAWSLSCGIKTAQARLDSFIKLIKIWESEGYDESRPSSILDNNDIIDGAHRIALAVFEKREHIVCDIYSKLEESLEVHTNDVKMTRGSLEKAGFSQDKIDIIENIRKRINEQYL